MKSIVYPDWVEKYRKKGVTIRKVRSGYGLYKCTTKYVKGSKPAYVQEYLGMVTEDKGFIPKHSYSSPSIPFIEYGLSHFIWLNMHRHIQRSLFHAGTDELIRLGIIFYIFGNISEAYIRSSWISIGHEDDMLAYSKTANISRVHAASNSIDKAFRELIPDDSEIRSLKALLSLSVYDPSLNMPSPLPPAAIEIIQKRGLRYE